MARTKNRLFAQFVGQINSDATVKSTAIEGGTGGAEVYDSAGALPLTGITAGDQAWSGNRLYISNGTGWYNIALVNADPRFTSITDSDGVSSPFALSNEGNPTTITLLGADSDNTDVIYSFTKDAGFDGLATISGSGDTYVITPLSEDSATTTSGTVTFRVSDGISFDNSVNTFTLNFSFELDITGTFTVSSNTLDIGISADDIEFKSDGTKMWALGNAGGIRQYSLSVPWDLSSATQDSLSSFSWSHPNQYPQGIAVTADGTSAIILDEGNGGRVYQYDMSTPYDMNTATYNTSRGEVQLHLGHSGSSNSESGQARWYNAGRILLLYGRSRSVWSVIDCSANPYSLTGAVKLEATMLRDYDAGSYGSAAGIFSSDGTIIDMLGGTFVDTQARRLVCSTPWRPSTANTSSVTSWTLPAGGGTGSENGFTHSPDMTKLFVSVGNVIKRIDIT